MTPLTNHSRGNLPLGFKLPDAPTPPEGFQYVGVQEVDPRLHQSGAMFYSLCLNFSYGDGEPTESLYWAEGFVPVGKHFHLAIQVH